MSSTDEFEPSEVQVLAMKSCKPGYVYWVCAKGDYAHIKNGYTTKADPTEYCEEQYSRTMVPMEIVAIVPVANCTLMEKVSHHALHPVRVHGRHEVFDLSLPDGSLDRARLDSAIKVVTTLTELSGLPLPEDPDVIAQRKALEKIRQAEARKVQTAKRKAEREAEKQAEKERAKQRRVEEAEQLAEEKRQDREVGKQVRLQKIQSDINTFINNMCIQAPQAREAVGTFKKRLESHYDKEFTANDIKQVMLNLGFIYKKTNTVRIFIGVSCNDSCLQQWGSDIAS